MNQLNGQKKSEEINDETMVLIDLFQRAFFPKPDLTPMEYLEQYDTFIRATGRVLELLGLAKPIECRIIGWKSTRRLIDLLAEPGARALKATRKKASFTEFALVNLLLLAADIDPYDGNNDAGFAIGVLEQLGLVRQDGAKDWKPTDRLVELVVEVHLVKLIAYFDKVPSDIVPAMQKS
jgi:hypothetical protein